MLTLDNPKVSPVNAANRNHKVLIVDDEDLVRILLSHIIERMHVPDVQILLAEDGVEALTVIQREHPDLILLDVLLPKLNGYDVCQHVRQMPNYDPYIIILTARGVKTDRQHSEQLGANDFMNKPFDPSYLTTRLTDIWKL
ncbi:MAG TPA: response regulator [Phototrophicaceae bacterium]|nr:response regulator [Phototrophicaceae bacterium]